MKKLVLSAAVLLHLSALGGWAADFSRDAAGTASLGFLKLGADARAAAMGGAYTAFGGDASALYWNPAGLVRLEGRSAVISRASYAGTLSLNYAAYAAPVKKLGVCGVSVDYMSAGSVRETDDTGVQTGTMNLSDTAVSAGCAKKYGGWGLGVSYKFISSKLAASASAHAFDAGVLSPAYAGGALSFAAALLNFGGSIKYEEKAERLPFALKAGTAYKLGARTSLAADACFPIDEAPYLALGAENEMYGSEKLKFYWRAGFNTGSIGDFGGFNGFSGGIGFLFKSLRADYAVVPQGDLGLSSRLSLTYGF